MDIRLIKNPVNLTDPISYRLFAVSLYAGQTLLVQLVRLNTQKLTVTNNAAIRIRRLNEKTKDPADSNKTSKDVHWTFLVLREFRFILSSIFTFQI